LEKRKSLKANFAFALIGNILYTISQYLILTLLIKNFRSDEVGGYLYALAFVSPIVIPFDMQLRSFYITERKNGLSFHDYQGFRLVSNGLALVMVLVTALILKPDMLLTISLVGVSKIIESQSDMYYGAAQKAERMDYISYSKFFKGIAALALVGICIYAGMNINQILIAWAALWFVVLILFDARITLRVAGIQRRMGIVFNKEIFISIFKISLPVLILSFVDKFAANYPNYVVENRMGLSAVAIFGAIIYFRSIGAQVINPMGAVVAPRLADYYSDGRHADFMHLLKRTTFSAFLLGIAGIIIAVLFGKWILPLLYTSEYTQYASLLVLVMVYCLVTYLYVFIGTAITCLRVHWIKLPIHIVSFGVLALLMFFTKELTLQAVVINMIVAETVMFVLYTTSFLVLYNKIKGNGYAPKGLFKNIV
jgi:O-antigen/teichoic acid export membrane protein